MYTLRESTDTFDNDAKFTFEITRYNGEKSKRTGYIFKDERENKVYVMQSSAVLKSHYSEEDIALLDRLNNMEPIKTNDVVLFEGHKYAVVIKGDYSDAGFLKLIGE